MDSVRNRTSIVALGAMAALSFAVGSAPADSQPNQLQLLVEINPGEADGLAFSSNEFFTGGSKIYFKGCQSATGCEPWVSDGTASGTFMLADVRPGSEGTLIFYLGYTDNGILLFDADDGVTGRELWRSDGSPGGTYQVADLRPGTSGSGLLESNFETLGTLAIFQAKTASSVTELLVYDTAVPALPPQSLLGSAGRPLGRLGDTLNEIVVTNSPPGGGIGREPMRTDGATVTLILDHNPGPADGVHPLSERSATSQGRVFFVGSDGLGEVHEMFSTDGIGIRSHGVVAPGPGDGDIGDLVAHNGGVTFTVDAGVSARELWFAPAMGDAIPVLVPGAGQPSPASFVEGTNFVYFRGDAGGTGQELWRTDGTVAGTFAIDLLAGAGGSNTTLYSEYLGRFYFKSRDSDSADFGLWRTDGTLAGTEPVLVDYDEAFTGSWSGVAGGVLFIAVDTPELGLELWTLDLSSIFTSGFEAGDLSSWSGASP